MTSPDQPPGWHRSSYSGQLGNCVEIAGPCWYKPSYSNPNGNCVEVAAEPGRWLVRDSKDPSGPVLSLSGLQWAAFIQEVQDGQTR